VRPDTINWLDSAVYDIETAKYMLSSGRFIYVIFFCHLAIEKLLKALVSEITDEPAPRSHDLIYLAKRADIQLEPGQYEFVSKLNNASVPTRYPSDMQKILSEYTKQVASSYLKQTEEVTKWLKSHPKLKG
jgi:HEPN domain-containing protein